MPDPVDHVDPFIGVDGAGATLCGPYHPLGLVRLGPDTVPPHRTNGYRSDLPLQGFSHTHVSGTGGAGRFGNIGLTPFIGPPRPDPAPNERLDERAGTGFYSVNLDPANIRAELTSTERCGLSRFTYPEGQQANLMIDASAVHNHTGDGPAKCVDASISWTSATNFEGQGTFQGGWGHNYPYDVYFSGEVSQPPDEICCVDEDGLHPTATLRGALCKTIAHWRDIPCVEARIGVSFVSIEKARASLQREVLKQTFEETRAANRAAWQSWFDRISVEGGTDRQRTIFYTFVTRLLCMPTDLGVNDEFEQWPSAVRHFSEYYCLWDSVRNANSLISLIAPELERDMLNCLLDVAENTGWLPDAWITGHSTHIQGGSSADILFNEAHLKGINGIDYSKALHFMRKNNEVESPDPYQYGRYLPHYRDLGYVSTDAINCVSRHLEYAYQDWCTGSLAKRLGDTATAQASHRSASKLWNLWNEDLKHFAPRTPEGDWATPFDINTARPDSWNDPYFYEGVSRAWSYNTQHDFAGLVARCGGPRAFESRLDKFFAASTSECPAEHPPHHQRFPPCATHSCRVSFHVF